MIDYLSYSSINLYLTCAENWRRKYLLKEYQPPTPALVFGSAFHATIEDYLTAVHEGKLGVDLSACWSTAWNAKMNAEGDQVEWEASTPEYHHNEGLRILGDAAVSEMIFDVKPMTDAEGVFMERKIELTVPGVPVPIIGYIDVVTEGGIPGDFKTSSKRWSQSKAEAELQPLFYLAALNQMGMDVPDLKFRHYVVTKAKSPSAQVMEHTHTWDEIFWLFELIRKVWEGIEAETFPMNPNGWLCGSKWCAYWSTCRGAGA